MSEPISAADVRYVARLARLALTEAEVETFTTQLGTVLAHAADVATLDLSGIAPTAHPFELANVLREDEPVPGLTHDEAMAAAPAVEDGRFRVPQILGEAP